MPLKESAWCGLLILKFPAKTCKMNKKFTYIMLVALFIGLSAFVVIRYNVRLAKKQVTYYPLLERHGAIAKLPEWPLTRSTGDKLFRKYVQKPDDAPTAIALASLFIQESRITGNYTYYDAAAMKYINEILVSNPQHFEALILKAILQLSQHHFSDALETAGIAQKINPYNSFVYGIMVDANVELGNYAQAVENSDKMMSIRPDMRSYARVSYLREIHGDLPGAIEAMKMAVEAGAYGDEGTAWSRIQLARLYENTGDLRSAEMHYLIALEQRPAYGYAIAGLGHLAMGSKNYPKAIQLYQQADSIVRDFALKEQLAELYGLSGDKVKSEATVNTVISELTKAAAEGEQSINHHADKELAYVYLMKNDYDRALQHAKTEYSRRPDNIDVNDALAWVYYQSGEVQKALPYMEKALRTQCKNPVLLCHAGLIYTKSGNKEKGKMVLTQALAADPNIDPVLKQESSAVLKSL